ncbi:MAG: polyprenyl synthetase family protein [Candidatus Paceibacterota bacterium]
MKKRLKKETESLKKKLNSCLEIYSYDSIDKEVYNEIRTVFALYSPLKERSFLMRLIYSHYAKTPDTNDNLYLAIELAFSAYYLKDDLTDNTHLRNGKETLLATRGRNYTLTLSDYILELSHSLLLKFIERNSIQLQNFDNPFLDLSLGQFYTDYIRNFDDLKNIEEEELVRLKAGSLFGKGVDYIGCLISKEHAPDVRALVKIAEEMGSILQIMNDIQNFLLQPSHDQILSDLRDGKANYILIKYIKETSPDSSGYLFLKSCWKKKIPFVNIQDKVFSILEEAVIFSNTFYDLNNRVSKIIYLINNNLKNEAIKEQLKKYCQIFVKEIPINYNEL